MATIDTHAHIFRRGLTLADVRRYAPDYDAPLEHYLNLLDNHGIACGVLIQPSFLGTDNSFLLDGLRQAPDRLRGIAVVDPETTLRELTAMDSAGVVGIRLNLAGGVPVPDLYSVGWRKLLARIADLGWQVDVHSEARDLPRILPALLTAGVNIVVDHFGRPDPALGVDDPGLRYLLEIGKTGRVWIKLSAAYRNGWRTVQETDAIVAVSLFRRAFGIERLIWGSDWPHTQYESGADYRHVRTVLDAWLPDARDQKAILVDTPTSLFRFTGRAV